MFFAHPRQLLPMPFIVTFKQHTIDSGIACLDETVLEDRVGTRLTLRDGTSGDGDSQGTIRGKHKGLPTGKETSVDGSVGRGGRGGLGGEDVDF